METKAMNNPIVNLSHEHIKVGNLLEAAEDAYDAYMKHSLWHERGCSYMDSPMEKLRSAIDSLVKHVGETQNEKYSGPLW